MPLFDKDRAGLEAEASGDALTAERLAPHDDIGDGPMDRKGFLTVPLTLPRLMASTTRPQQSNDFLGTRRYDFSVKRHESTPAEVAEAVRVKRLREDAKRPLSVNLAETIELSHALLKMAEASKRR